LGLPTGAAIPITFVKESKTMNTTLLFIGPIGGSELFILVGIPLCYLLPIYLSIKKYPENKSYWKILSILGVLMGSWIGYIIVSSLYAARRGYVDERLKSRSTSSRE
jgi:hypothetical protein